MFTPLTSDSALLCFEFNSQCNLLLFTCSAVIHQYCMLLNSAVTTSDSAFLMLFSEPSVWFSYHSWIQCLYPMIQNSFACTTIQDMAYDSASMSYDLMVLSFELLFLPVVGISCYVLGISPYTSVNVKFMKKLCVKDTDMFDTTVQYTVLKCLYLYVRCSKCTSV